MPFIKYGDFLPDLPDYKNPGCLVANNVIPYGDGYRPLKEVTTFTNALDDRVQGMANVRIVDGSSRIFAGDVNKLYLLQNSTFSDVSQAGGYTVSQYDQWNFTVFGNLCIATALGQNIQKFEVGVDSAFSDLTSIQAKYCTTVRDFLVVGHTSAQSQRVRWSALNDPTDWSPSQATQSDYQDLVGDHGPVMGLAGGEFLTIFMQNAIFRGDFVGTPLIFQFSKVNSTHGALKSGSIVSVGNNTYYLSDDGFYMFDGRQSIPIGANKIDKYFLNDYSTTYADRICAAVDPVEQLIFWAYPSSTSSGELDKLLIFNYNTGRWSTADVMLQTLGQAQTPGYTLEQLDNIGNVDTIGPSFDSPLWAGGRMQLAGFDENKKMGVFAGSVKDATITTGEVDMEGRRSTIRLVRPIVDGGTSTVQVGSREKQGASVVYNTAVSLNASGEAPIRKTNRYHRFKTNITGDFTNAFGIDVELAPEGRR